MNHKYSTFVLLGLFLVFSTFIVLGEITNDDLNYFCNEKNNIPNAVYVISGINKTWTCSNLLDQNVINITVNNITNLYTNHSVYADEWLGENLSLYVPYTGATQDVNLSLYNLTVTKVTSGNYDDTYLVVGNSNDSSISFTVSDQELLKLTTDQILYGEDLVPLVSSAYDLGTATNLWNRIWANNITINNTLKLNNIQDSSGLVRLDFNEGNSTSTEDFEVEKNFYVIGNSTFGEPFGDGNIVTFGNKRYYANDLTGWMDKYIHPSTGLKENFIQNATLFGSSFVHYIWTSYDAFSASTPQTFYHWKGYKDGGENDLLNLSRKGLIVNGNVTADYFKGDGSLLTGISSGNSFNQSLNTTDNVVFNEVNVSTFLRSTGKTTLASKDPLATLDNSGTSSLVFGFADDTFDLGFGLGNISSSGIGSVAGGLASGFTNPFIISSGDGSFAGGKTVSGFIKGVGDGSFTWGSGNQLNLHTGGVNFGSANTLNGTSKTSGTAIGGSNVVSESYGLALGFSNTVLGGATGGASAIGSSNTVSAQGSSVLGSGNNGNLANCFLFGKDLTCISTSSATIGISDSKIDIKSGLINITDSANVVGNVTLKDVLTITPRSSAPSGSLGMLYVDSDSNELCFYNGTAWSGLQHGGTCA